MSPSLAVFLMLKSFEKFYKGTLSLELWVVLLRIQSASLYSRRRRDHRREWWATADWFTGRHRHGGGHHGSSRPYVCLHVQPPHLQRKPLLHGGQCHPAAVYDCPNLKFPIIPWNVEASSSAVFIWITYRPGFLFISQKVKMQRLKT